MSTKSAGTLGVANLATGTAKTGEHMDMAQIVSGTMKRRFIELSRAAWISH